MIIDNNDQGWIKWQIPPQKALLLGHLTPHSCKWNVSSMIIFFFYFFISLISSSSSWLQSPLLNLFFASILHCELSTNMTVQEKRNQIFSTSFLHLINISSFQNKLASLKATLLQNYNPVREWVTGVNCRATSVAKKRSHLHLFLHAFNTYESKKRQEISPFLNLLLFCLLCKQLRLQGRQLALHLKMRIMMRGSKYADMVCVGTKCKTRRMNCKTNDGQADAAV